MKNNLNINLGKAFNTVNSLWTKTVKDHEDEIGKEYRIDAIERTTASLYDAGVGDDTIIIMLQRYWGLTEEEAYKFLREEKVVNYPCRALVAYLRNTEALTLEGADDFIKKHHVVDVLLEEEGVWKLTPQELLEKIKEIE